MINQGIEAPRTRSDGLSGLVSQRLGILARRRALVQKYLGKLRRDEPFDAKDVETLADGFILLIAGLEANVEKSSNSTEKKISDRAVIRRALQSVNDSLGELRSLVEV